MTSGAEDQRPTWIFIPCSCGLTRGWASAYLLCPLTCSQIQVYFKTLFHSRRMPSFDLDFDKETLRVASWLELGGLGSGPSVVLGPPVGLESLEGTGPHLHHVKQLGVCPSSSVSLGTREVWQKFGAG
jgi:hypothetical protein